MSGKWPNFFSDFVGTLTHTNTITCYALFLRTLEVSSAQSMEHVVFHAHYCVVLFNVKRAVMIQSDAYAGSLWRLWYSGQTFTIEVSHIRI